MKRLLITFLFSLSLFFTIPVQAAVPVAEIVQRANLVSYYGGDDGKALVAMTITDQQGRTRHRLFTILRKDVEDGGRQFYFVYFKKPSDVRKTTFLVHKFIDKDDDRWMYLPSLDLVKRIAASDKRTSFMGSHYLYEDVSGRNINEDRHELESEDNKFFILKNTPLNPDSVEFSSYRVWIDKKNFMPMKAEYLDKSGMLYRRIEVLASHDIEGIPTVTKSKVTDLADGGSTIAEFSKIDYNIGFKESLFSERYLRRPPREARK